MGKGVATAGQHKWIGILYSFTEEGHALMELTPEYQADLLASMRPFGFLTVPTNWHVFAVVAG